MAVHLISLDQLESMCAVRARVEEFPPGAEPSRRQTPTADEPAKATDRPSESSAVSASPPPAHSARTTDSLEDLLSSPASELKEYLSESGASSAKVLLKLFYGLATLKAEVADLRAHVGRGVAAPRKADTPVSDHTPTGSEKSDVLEQVFRQNMSLKDMD